MRVLGVDRAPAHRSGRKEQLAVPFGHEELDGKPARHLREGAGLRRRADCGTCPWPCAQTIESTDALKRAVPTTIITINARLDTSVWTISMINGTRCCPAAPSLSNS